MIICGKKEYIYDKCNGCVHSYFSVAVGLHPDYGYWIHCCSLSKCSPLYKEFQLKLFDL